MTTSASWAPCGPCSSRVDSDRLDIVIRGARVVDGTGSPAYLADLGITGARIVAIAREGDNRPSGRRAIDAAGLVVTPGYIDMHSHSDLAVLSDADHLAKVAQGCTLEVVGQDGLGYAPCDEDVLPDLRAQLASWNGSPAGLDISWRSVEQYLDLVDMGSPTNVAALVPQGTLRMMVVGWDDRQATAQEQQRMRDLLARELDGGAVGMSSGLTYPPGMHASTAELEDLCRVLAAYGAYYCPHTRSYGAGALEAYAEVIGLARATGCALHLAHATMNFPVNAGRADELLALVDAATSDGVDITLDSYPYLSGSTSLAALLPSWTTVGGPAQTLRRIRSADTRARIRHELDALGTDGNHGVPVDWRTIEVSGVRNRFRADTIGRSIADVADACGAEPSEAYLQLLVDDDLGSTCLMHVGCEDNVRAIMRHPTHTGGSDGILVGDKPHPRAWGTFARYLGHYVRELGVLTLEDCVHHLTGRPARRLGLRDRGQIAPGYAADLVLVDPATVTNRATYTDPRRTPTGIPWVLVNGEAVIEDGSRTSALPGRSVRRNLPPSG